MSTINDGGPAFPLAGEGPNTPCFNEGMSLRDWFAASALQGWLAGIAGAEWMDDYTNEPEAFAEHQKCVAETAYRYADAMLATRERGTA